MEEATTYNFSEGIRRAKKRYMTLAITLPVFLIVFIFLNPMSRDLNVTAIIIITLVSFVLIGLTVYFTATRALRKLSELSVQIFPDRLVRRDLKQKEIFFWKDLLNGKIIESSNGETTAIKLSFANKKIITLFGFEGMEATAKQIEQYIPDNILLNRKRARVNWDNPAAMVFIMILTLLIILAILKIGKNAYQFFNVIFFMVFGLYSMIARPVSRTQGKGWKKFETITGIIMIVCSVLLLVATLFSI